jgi:hypothetical protein
MKIRSVGAEFHVEGQMDGQTYIRRQTDRETDRKRDRHYEAKVTFRNSEKRLKWFSNSLNLFSAYFYGYPEVFFLGLSSPIRGHDIE